MKKIITFILCLLGLFGSFYFILPHIIKKPLETEVIAQCNEVGDVDISLLSTIEQSFYEEAKTTQELLQIWFLAEKISKKTPYTKNDKKVVLQLICDGGTYLVLRQHIYTYYQTWRGRASPAATEDAVNNYYQIWRDSAPHKIFDLCNYVRSDYGMAVCESRYSQKKKQIQDHNLNIFKAKLSPMQQQYLTEAYDTAIPFLESSTGEELYGGTSRAMLMISSIRNKRTVFVKEIYDLYKNKVSIQKPAQLTLSDQKLNRLYKKLKIQLKQEPIIEVSFSFTFKDLQKTQRKWIKYRDSFSAFVHELNPDISIDDWKFELTQRRNQQLEQLLQKLNDFS